MAAWLLLAWYPGARSGAAQYAAMTRLNTLSALALFGFFGGVLGPERRITSR
jgi:hypothetical protein